MDTSSATKILIFYVRLKLSSDLTPLPLKRSGVPVVCSLSHITPQYRLPHVFFFLFSCPLFPYYLPCECAVRAAVCVHLLFHHTVACRNHAAPALLSCNQPPFRLPGAHGSQWAFLLSDLSYLCLLDSHNYLTHSTYVLLGDTECIRNCGMDAIHCVSLSCHVHRFKTGVSEVTYIFVTRQI